MYFLCCLLLSFPGFSKYIVGLQMLQSKIQLSLFTGINGREHFRSRNSFPSGINLEFGLGFEIGFGILPGVCYHLGNPSITSNVFIFAVIVSARKIKSRM